MRNEGELLEAVETCNYLAQHFLREFFMAVPFQKNLHDASGQLADLAARERRRSQPTRLSCIRQWAEFDRFQVQSAKASSTA